MKAFIIFCIIVIFIFSCKRVTDPLKHPKDFKKLQWEVDTLYAPNSTQNMMESIWGASADNVYTVGHHSGPGDGEMWHFDGQSWQIVNLHDDDIFTSLDGQVFGFSSDNIWAVGLKPRRNPNPPPDYLFYSIIINYNGINWQYSLKDQSGAALISIGGLSSYDIWAGGMYHTLYHYDGENWSRDSLNYNFPEHKYITITEIKGRPGFGVYMTVSMVKKSGGANVYYLFKYEDGSWKELVNTDYYIKSYVGLWVSPTGKVYMGGDELRVWDGDLKTLIYNQRIISLYGIDDNNIFLTGLKDGGARVYYYNGKELFEYKQLSAPASDMVYTDVWSDGNEVFVVGVTLSGFPNKSIVWHGK